MQIQPANPVFELDFCICETQVQHTLCVSCVNKTSSNPRAWKNNQGPKRSKATRSALPNILEPSKLSPRRRSSIQSSTWQVKGPPRDSDVLFGVVLIFDDGLLRRCHGFGTSFLGRRLLGSTSVAGIRACEIEISPCRVEK